MVIVERMASPDGECIHGLMYVFQQKSTAERWLSENDDEHIEPPFAPSPNPSPLHTFRFASQNQIFCLWFHCSRYNLSTKGRQWYPHFHDNAEIRRLKLNRSMGQFAVH